MAEAGADRLCPEPRAPRNPTTRSRAGDTTAAVSPSPAPRARGSRPAERGLSKTKSERPGGGGKSGSDQPFVSSRDSFGLRCPGGVVERDAASAPERQRACGERASSAGGSEARRRCSRQPRAVHVASPGPLPRATPGPPAGGGGKLQK